MEDPDATETVVSVYMIDDLSHNRTQYKVDAIAKESLTGCAVISEGISVVVVEGGPESIKRYGKLTLRRINWGAAEDEPTNKCLLVWQGSVAKPSFNMFLIHRYVTDAGGRRVFADAGVGHYWDLAINFSEDRSDVV